MAIDQGFLRYASQPIWGLFALVGFEPKQGISRTPAHGHGHQGQNTDQSPPAGIALEYKDQAQQAQSQYDPGSFINFSDIFYHNSPHCVFYWVFPGAKYTEYLSWGA